MPSPARRPETLSPGWQLVVLLGLLLAGFCVGSLLGVGMVMAGFGFSYEQIKYLAITRPPHTWAASMIIQGAGMAGVGAAILTLPKLVGSTIQAYFAPHPLRGPGWPLVASLLFIVLLPALSVLTAWNAGVQFPDWAQGFAEWARVQEDQHRDLTLFLTAFSTPARLLVGLVVIALVPAAAEELMFRGVLQPNLIRLLGSRHLGIWLSAAIFSAIHIQFFGFVPRLLLGVILGYLYEWSGNILVSMAAHFTNNAIQLLLLYFYQHDHLPATLNPDSTQALPWPAVLVSAVLTLGLLGLLHQRQRRPAPEATV